MLKTKSKKLKQAHLSEESQYINSQKKHKNKKLNHNLIALKW